MVGPVTALPSTSQPRNGLYVIYTRQTCSKCIRSKSDVSCHSNDNNESSAHLEEDYLLLEPVGRFTLVLVPVFLRLFLQLFHDVLVLNELRLQRLELFGHLSRENVCVQSVEITAKKTVEPF